MNYGLPYMGSKNAIVADVCEVFPPARHFYDLFCGGCSITHFLMRRHRFQQFHINDITDTPTLFADAVNGLYNNETRWISRADFFALKDTDPYVRYCWSFGNNGECYMYSREVEPWKRALHFAYVFHDYEPMRQFGITDQPLNRQTIIKNRDKYKAIYVDWYLREVLHTTLDIYEQHKHLSVKIAANAEKLRLFLCDALKRSNVRPCDVDKLLGTNGMAGHYFGKSQWAFPTREAYEQMQTIMDLPQPYDEVFGLQEYLQQVESLQRLQRLQSLERLQSLQSLQSTIGDYQAVPIEPDSIIYCDIPYRGTTEYVDGGFDYERFYDWACRQSVPVFISEYDMPRDRFECIKEIRKRCCLAATNNSRVTTERIFIPKGQKLYHARQLSLF